MSDIMKMEIIYIGMKLVSLWAGEGGSSPLQFSIPDHILHFYYADCLLTYLNTACNNAVNKANKEHSIYFVLSSLMNGLHCLCAWPNYVDTVVKNALTQIKYR